MSEPDQSATRKPSAIDYKIKELVRNSRYFKAVADGNGDKSSPEYQAHAEHLIGLAIGAAVGSGELYRKREAVTDSPPADHMKALREDARWFAAAAAQSIAIDKSSDRYAALSDAVVDAAISTAVATGKLKAPQRSFAERVTDSRATGPAEGPSV